MKWYTHIQSAMWPFFSGLVHVAELRALAPTPGRITDRGDGTVVVYLPGWWISGVCYTRRHGESLVRAAGRISKYDCAAWEVAFSLGGHKAVGVMIPGALRDDGATPAGTFHVLRRQPFDPWAKDYLQPEILIRSF